MLDVRQGRARAKGQARPDGDIRAGPLIDAGVDGGARADHKFVRSGGRASDRIERVLLFLTPAALLAASSGWSRHRPNGFNAVMVQNRNRLARGSVQIDREAAIDQEPVPCCREG